MFFRRISKVRVLFPRNFLVNLRRISKARVLFPRNVLVNLRGNIQAHVFIYEEIQRPAFSNYEFSTVNFAYVELTSPAFFILRIRRKLLVSLRVNNEDYV